MRRAVSLHPASLALGLVLGLICLVATALAPALPTGDSWPPAKRNIVNVFQTELSVAIPPGGTLAVYTVPPDRWLTLTASTVSASGFLYLAEEHAGVLERKGLGVEFNPVGQSSMLFMSPEGGGGPIGWTFRPGSSVVLENPWTSNGSNVSRYSLLGFLSRD